MRFTVELSPEEVKDIVVQHLKSKMKEVHNIDFTLDSETVGVGYSERIKYTFGGVKAEVEVEL